MRSSKLALVLTIAATVAAPSVAFAAAPNSTAFYNAARQRNRGETITASVVNGSYVREVERVHPYERLTGTGTSVQPDPLAAEFRSEQARARREKVDANRKANREALQTFCKQDLRAADPRSEGQCVK